MSSMAGDHWPQLLALKDRLVLAPDRLAALQALDVDETTFELVTDDIDAGMFLVASSRLAELTGASIARVDIGSHLVIGFGRDTEDARQRLQQAYRRRQRDVDMGIDGEEND